MSYKYITENNLEHKQTYMYSEYGGMNFLLEYECIRQEFIKKYPSDNLSIEEFFSENTKTIRELSDIYCLLAKEEEMDYSRLDGYLKSFEVRKKLYDCYQGYTFKPVNEDNYGDTMTYILLSACLYLAYERTKCLKYYNSMLKVNDTLISLEKLMGREECKLVSFYLEKELGIYHALAHDIKGGGLK